MNDLWDVYIWPINNASAVRRVGASLPYDDAVKIYNGYLEGDQYDAYMVPEGTKIYL